MDNSISPELPPSSLALPGSVAFTPLAEEAATRVAVPVVPGPDTPGTSYRPDDLDYGFASSLKDGFASGRDEGLAAMGIDHLALAALGSDEFPIPVSDWGNTPLTKEAQAAGLIYKGDTPSQLQFLIAKRREMNGREQRAINRTDAAAVGGFAASFVGGMTDPADLASSFVGGALVKGVRTARVLTRGSAVAMRYASRSAYLEAAALHARDGAFVRTAMGRVGSGFVGGVIDNATWRPAAMAGMYDRESRPYTSAQWLQDAAFGGFMGGIMHGGGYVASNGLNRLAHRTAVTRALEGVQSAQSLEGLSSELERFSPAFNDMVARHRSLREVSESATPDLDLSRRLMGDLVRDYGRDFREAVGGHNEARIQEIRTKVYGRMDDTMGMLFASMDDAGFKDTAPHDPAVAPVEAGMASPGDSFRGFREKARTFMAAVSELSSFDHWKKAGDLGLRSDFDTHMAMSRDTVSLSHAVPGAAASADSLGHALGSVLGVKVRLMKESSPNKGMVFINHPDAGRTVFVNEGLLRNPLALASTVMHEWSHSLMRRDPVAYGDLVASLHSLTPETPGQPSLLALGHDRVSVKYGNEWLRFGPERRMAETVAASLEVLSEQSPAFWKALSSSGSERFVPLLPYLSELSRAAHLAGDVFAPLGAHGEAIASAVSGILDKTGLGEPLREVPVADIALARSKAHALLASHMADHPAWFPKGAKGSAVIREIRSAARRAADAFKEETLRDLVDGDGTGPDVDVSGRILASSVPVESSAWAQTVPGSAFRLDNFGSIPVANETLRAVERELGLVPLSVIRSMETAHGKEWSAWVAANGGDEAAARAKAPAELRATLDLVEHHRRRWCEAFVTEDTSGNTSRPFFRENARGVKRFSSAHPEGRLAVNPLSQAGMKLESAEMLRLTSEWANRNGMVAVAFDAEGRPVDTFVSGTIRESSSYYVELRRMTEPAAPRLTNTVETAGGADVRSRLEGLYDGETPEPDKETVSLGVYLAGQWLRSPEGDEKAFLAGLPSSVREVAATEISAALLSHGRDEAALRARGDELSASAVRYEAGARRPDPKADRKAVARAKSTLETTDAWDTVLDSEKHTDVSIRAMTAALCSFGAHDPAAPVSFNVPLEQIHADLARLFDLPVLEGRLRQVVESRFGADEGFLRRLHGLQAEYRALWVEDAKAADRTIRRTFRQRMEELDNGALIRTATRLNPDGSLHVLSNLPEETRAKLRASGLRPGDSHLVTSSLPDDGSRVGLAPDPIALSFDDAIALDEDAPIHGSSDLRDARTRLGDSLDVLKHALPEEKAGDWSAAVSAAMENNPDAGAAELLSASVRAYGMVDEFHRQGELAAMFSDPDTSSKSFDTLVKEGRSAAGDPLLPPIMAAARAIEESSVKGSFSITFPDLGRFAGEDGGMASPGGGPADRFGFFSDLRERAESFARSVMGDDLSGTEVALHPVRNTDNAVTKRTSREGLLRMLSDKHGLAEPAASPADLLTAVLPTAAEVAAGVTEEVKAARTGLSPLLNHYRVRNAVETALVSGREPAAGGAASDLLHEIRTEALHTARFRAHEAGDRAWLRAEPTADDLRHALDDRTWRVVTSMLSEQRANRVRAWVGDSADKAMALLAGRFRDGGNKSRGLNLDNRIHSYRDEVYAPVKAVMMTDGIGRLFTENDRVARAASAAIRGDDTLAKALPANERTAALRMAEAIDNAREFVRQRVCSSGRFIARSASFAGFDARHNFSRISGDVAGWRRFMTERIDWERTSALHGGVMSDGTPFRRDAYLLGVFHELSDQGGEIDQPVRDTSSLNRKTYHNRIAWKDSSAAFDYDMAYGTGRTAATMLHDIGKVSRETVVWEMLGEKPRDLLNGIVNALPSETALQGFRRNGIRDTVSQVLGDLSSSENPAFSRMGHTLRGVADLAFMPLAAISVLGDMGNMAATMRYMGVRVGSVDAALWKGMAEAFANRKDPVSAQYLLAHGVGAEVAQNAMTDVLSSEGFHGAVDSGRHVMLSLNGFGLLTRMQDRVFVNVATMDLAEKALSGTLDAAEIRALGQAGITQADLPALAKAVTEVSSVGDFKGRRVDARLITDTALRDKVFAYLRDFRTQGQLQADAGTLATLACGTKRGSLAREVLSVATQYMAIPVTTMHKLWGRFRHGYGDAGMMRAMSDPSSNAAVHLAAWVGTGLVMGYTSYNLARLARGEQVTAMDDTTDKKKVMLNALVAGGSLGLARSAITGYIGGPLPHVAWNVAQGAQAQVFEKSKFKRDEAGRRAVSSLGGLTPFMGPAVGPALGDKVYGPRKGSEPPAVSTARTAGMLTMGSPLLGLSLYGISEAMKAGMETRSRK